MTRAALVIAALLSIALAWRATSPRQRQIATTLALLAAIDTGRPFVAAWPAFYVAGFVAFYGVTAWGVSATLAPWRGVVLLLFAPMVALSGEAFRRGMTGPLARVAFALALAAQVLAAIRFASRGRWPDGAQRVALMLTASLLADLAGPWRVGSPASLWYVQNITSALTWITIAGWELRCLTRARR